MQPNSTHRPINIRQEPISVAPPTARLDGDGLDFVLQERRDVEFRQAARHSTKVKFLKFLLPVVGVLVIVGISGAMILNSMLNPGVTVDNIALTDGKLIMENPKLNGFDSKQRPYNLSAEKAIQDAKRPTFVELQQINATLPIDEKFSAEVNAGQGFYDADAKTLLLENKVTVLTENGMTLTLEDADVDIGNGTLKTNKAIAATSERADINANSLIVHENGSHLIFEGGVRMTLRPDSQSKGDAQ